MNTFRYSRILIPRVFVDRITQQALNELPNECCGMLAGSIDSIAGVATITHQYPLMNQLQSPTRFRAEPKELLHVQRQMRKDSAELLAIYHSHPGSEPIPSWIDLEEHFYGDAVSCVILGMLAGIPEIRAWRLLPSLFEPLEWEVQD